MFKYLTIKLSSLNVFIAQYAEARRVHTLVPRFEIMHLTALIALRRFGVNISKKLLTINVVPMSAILTAVVTKFLNDESLSQIT